MVLSFIGEDFQSIEESSKLVIHIADAGEVTLHERFPLVIIGDPFVPGDPVGGAGRPPRSFSMSAGNWILSSG